MARAERAKTKKPEQVARELWRANEILKWTPAFVTELGRPRRYWSDSLTKTVMSSGSSLSAAR